MKNKIILTAIAVILIFILLNPTYSNFKEFTGLTGKDAEDLHKKANFLVCSIYQDNNSHRKYFGILKNFIDITPKEGPIDSTIVRTDSTVVKTDSAVSTIADSTTIKQEFDSAKAYDIIDGADTIHVSADTTSRNALKNLQALYKAVSSDYNLGTFPKFVNKLKDHKKRRIFYNDVSAKYDLGSYKQFESKINSFYLNQ